MQHPSLNHDNHLQLLAPLKSLLSDHSLLMPAPRTARHHKPWPGHVEVSLCYVVTAQLCNVDNGMPQWTVTPILLSSLLHRAAMAKACNSGMSVSIPHSRSVHPLVSVAYCHLMAIFCRLLLWGIREQIRRSCMAKSTVPVVQNSNNAL